MLGEADQAGLRLAESGDVQPVDAPIVGEGSLRAAEADEARPQVLEVRQGGRAAPEMRRLPLGAGKAEELDEKDRLDALDGALVSDQRCGDKIGGALLREDREEERCLSVWV